MDQGNLVPPSGEHMTPASIQLQQQAAQANAQAGGQSGGRPYEAKFHFNEISTNNLNGIVPHITIDSRYGRSRYHYHDSYYYSHYFPVLLGK